MARNERRVWWLLFCLWIAAAIIAYVYPLLKERDLGTFFQIIALSILAGGLLGSPVLITTIAFWRSLHIYQRCLGLLPAIYVLAPFALFG
jgi:hypothetical protein